MRYDSFREVKPGELPAIAHRNLLSAIDWVDHLFDIMDIQNLDDKVCGNSTFDILLQRRQ